MLRTLPSTLHRYPPYRKIEPAAPKHLHRRVDIVMAATVDSDYSSRRSSSNEQRESIMLPGCDSTPLLTLTSTLLLLFCKIEIVVSLTLVSSVNLSLVSVIKTLDFDPNHVDAGVSAIASHLTRSMAVSTSFGGVFKIWFCNSEKSQTVKDSSWMCHAVGSYK
ncbi:hypothetical protein F2Q69_00013158 [Brassica cretica]|uniref:Uncharacterized protein n=1 Tax=Brassica cretica TaxID=69181 RepID=A0A8S9R1Q1_BRACR|nr:hypothetical protein F2Q69_00013158 [Brassica cretica]